MRRRLAGWESLVALVAGATAGFTMQRDAFDHVTSELVTSIGFLIAAFVPAMVLAGTALRPGGFSIKQIRALGSAIDRQLSVFGGLFLYSLLACVLIIAGKMASWTMPALKVPGGVSIDASKVFPAGITFLTVFLLLRAASFVAGVRSIFRLTSQIAEDEARRRDQKLDDVAADDLASYKMPPDYGRRISLGGP